MHGKTLLLILGAVAFSALGQLGLKSGAQHLAGLSHVDFLRASVTDLHVLSGLAAWTVSTVCWLYVLRAAPLSRAYGLNSLTYVLVPVVSLFVFGEQVRRIHVAGMILILAGVACVLSGE